ncbi:MAG: hypothetical protein Q8J78_13595 [Moraxellaceae bacterium]|nr:hypothetical protein [Moraxellaceae bacterium]
MSEAPVPTTDPTPELTPEQLQQRRKNRRLLLLLLASFVVPFVIGQLAYVQNWYQGAATNHGRLLDPPLAVADLQAAAPAGMAVDAAFAKGKWWLVYVLPAECAQACRNRLFQMRQIRLATGRESERVRQLLIETGPVDAATAELLQNEFADFIRVRADASVVDVALQRASVGAANAGLLYLMDPMGWMMLTYPPEADEPTSVIKAEDTLKDLRKLLKASQIG